MAVAHSRIAWARSGPDGFALAVLRVEALRGSSSFLVDFRG